MARIGTFDPEILDIAWLDETMTAEGWFDEELLQSSGGPPPINAELDVVLEETTISASGAVGIEANRDYFSPELGGASLEAGASIQISAESLMSLDGNSLSAQSALPLSAELLLSLEDVSVEAKAMLAISGELSASLENAAIEGEMILSLAATLEALVDAILLTSQIGNLISAGLENQLEDVQLLAQATIPSRPKPKPRPTVRPSAAWTSQEILLPREPINARLVIRLDDVRVRAEAKLGEIPVSDAEVIEDVLYAEILD